VYFLVVAISKLVPFWDGYLLEPRWIFDFTLDRTKKTRSNPIKSLNRHSMANLSFGEHSIFVVKSATAT